MNEETILKHVWPVVVDLIGAVVREDEAAVAECLLAGSPAAELLDLFGLDVLDILLKTILDREELELNQVVEVAEGVFIEFAWAKPGITADGLPVDGAVSVLLAPGDGRFLIADVTPSGLELLLTEARARAILATSKILNQRQNLASEPWVLPLALFGGLLPLPLRPEALTDSAESLFLPSLQQRQYGVLTLLRARRLWRDFKVIHPLPIGHPAGWAAAVEWVMGEQSLWQMPVTAVAEAYGTLPATLSAHAEKIKTALGITGLDERYADWQMLDVHIQDED